MNVTSGTITIDFGSIIITYAVLIALALLGFRKGFRWILSICSSH
jgi:hypothetical protein